MGIYTTFGNLVHDAALDFGPRLAEARFRSASTRASISGHYDELDFCFLPNLYAKFGIT